MVQKNRLIKAPARLDAPANIDAEFFDCFSENICVAKLASGAARQAKQLENASMRESCPIRLAKYPPKLQEMALAASAVDID
jgi:hypothetical protein